YDGPQRLDMIAAYRVGEGLAVDLSDIALSVLWAVGQAVLPVADKRQLARQLIVLIDQRIASRAYQPTQNS
ncbi:MAG: bifunctional 4'-phosphopantothenoylcysteine decarboxylase/phosphopantothenoylcysteine synthetase, partial [Gammaproteobacteria bacterium]|nr:bifunctional 4'-phosphopantothenoylcysteine decarboxylase/phosphopantothenoylcysteine synthetase [Gammaproteobacteria bacterium]